MAVGGLRMGGPCPRCLNQSRGLAGCWRPSGGRARSTSRTKLERSSTKASNQPGEDTGRFSGSLGVGSCEQKPLEGKGTGCTSPMLWGTVRH